MNAAWVSRRDKSSKKVSRHICQVGSSKRCKVSSLSVITSPAFPTMQLLVSLPYEQGARSHDRRNSSLTTPQGMVCQDVRSASTNNILQWVALQSGCLEGALLPET